MTWPSDSKDHHLLIESTIMCANVVGIETSMTHFVADQDITDFAA